VTITVSVPREDLANRPTVLDPVGVWPAGMSSTKPAPRVLGYEILAELGRGGTGIVYKARDPRLKRLVALKMLIDGAFAGPAVLERFRAEAEVIARLAHPNFVQVYEVGESEGRPYLALELVEGGSLSRELEGGPLPVPRAVGLVATLAHAMEHAHRRGVVHRDLKPANVLLRDELRGAKSEDTRVSHATRNSQLIPLISDFGLAKDLASGANRGRTQSGAVLGTPCYMAPEQASGSRAAVGPSADVYALGAILYECLTGRPPFEGETDLDTLLAVVSSDPVPPSRLRPRLARDLDTICLKALAKQQGRRYPSALALAEDLDRFAAGEAVLARPESPIRKLARRARRHPVTIAASVLAAGGLLIAAYAISARSGEVRREAEADLSAARELNRRHEYASAVWYADRGFARVQGLSDDADLSHGLEAEARLAQRGLLAEKLHGVAESLRFRYDSDGLTAPERGRIEEQCRRLWSARGQIAGATGDIGEQTRIDLLDLALFWSGLRSGAGDPAGAAQLLDEAEALCGRDPAMSPRRRALGVAPGESDPEPTTAREYAARGRERLRAGDPAGAASDLQAAVDREPQGFWPNYYRGACAFKAGDHGRAVEAFSVCVALSPDRAECYYNRARACEELAQFDRALADYGRAMELAPRLTDARLNRGLLRHRIGDPAAALADLRAVLSAGRDDALVRYNLAVVCLGAGDPDAARAHLTRLRELDPAHPGLAELGGRLPAAPGRMP
jgi:serine/threonine-protein kinase